jgi:hypothetical protein
MRRNNGRWPDLFAFVANASPAQVVWLGEIKIAALRPAARIDGRPELIGLANRTPELRSQRHSRATVIKITAAGDQDQAALGSL